MAKALSLYVPQNWLGLFLGTKYIFTIEARCDLLKELLYNQHYRRCFPMRMLKYLAFTQIALTLALLAIGCSITAGISQKNVRGEWRISNSSTGFGGINAIAMLDENNWWATKNSTLLYSANSGKEWEVIYELPQQNTIGPKQLGRIEKIQFLDRKVGWLLAANLMFTEDGGGTGKRFILIMLNFREKFLFSGHFTSLIIIEAGLWEIFMRAAMKCQ